MEKAAPRSSTRGWGRCTLVAAASLAAFAPAHAAYVNPRLFGDRPWEPASVREPGRLGSLFPVPSEARLSGTDKKVREEYEVDLETGRIKIRQVYGKTLIGPEWVEDIPTAVKTVGRVSSANEWSELLRRKNAAGARASEQSVVTIDIPVEFPDAVADVIGQGARLNLTGSERITFTGTSNVISGGPQFESQTSSGFPDLDMRQQLRVNLDGTIGRKIHVLLNHDSEATTDLSNRIQLRYDGDEDEVVQKIEMGNTELSLPGADFLSFRKSQQGLFGAKAIGKFGPLDLTAIASKQEGQTARQSFVGQARSDSLVIRDVDFVKRKYYFIAPPESLATETAGVLPVTNFELFLDDQNPTNDLELQAFRYFAYADAAAAKAGDSTAVQPGWFHPLRLNVDYTFRPNAGLITLEQPLPADHVLACYFVTASGDSIGNFPAGIDSTVGTPVPATGLQIIAPSQNTLWDDTRGFVGVRDFELRNTYFLGARNILRESLEIVIRRRASGAGEQDLDKQQGSADPADNVEYVRILGLDNRGITASEPPDLFVDDEFADTEEGTLTFKNLTPFAPDSSTVNLRLGADSVSTGRSTEPGPKLLDYNAAMYSQNPILINNQWEYEIQVKYTTPTPTYSLNRFNILDGSERVRLNGRLLSRGTDYDIDYELGILTFKTPDANLPDVNIEVDFEFVPLFGQAKESLAGLSGTYNFDPLTRLSSSWLYYSKATPELRPRLGQEPSRIVVGDVFGQWQKNPTFMTGLVNALPFVTSEEASELSIQGEAAMSLPNPNTKNEIYIDDMEGVEDSRDLTITRALWVPASEPIGPDTPELQLNRENVPRLPFNWYNPDNVVRRKEVFPELTGQQEGEDFLQVLEFTVRDEEGATDPTRWMGIMRNLSTTGEDFSQKKFLEIWVNDFQRRQGKIIFDMGEISEDHYLETASLSTTKGRGFLDTEDIVPLIGDALFTKDTEDFGLDNVLGEDGAQIPGDDGNDDFEFERTENPDYRRINNTEDNNFLDTEDLDGDRALDRDNSYFSYVVDLADSVVVDSVFVPNPAVVQDNGQIVPGNGWRLFQIPLDEGVPVTVGGLPRRLAVKYARVWFDGLPEGPGSKLQIASLKIAGAAWQEEKFSRNDTGEAVDEATTALFTIKDVNNKEDPIYAGEEPFHPGEDANGLLRREQSLVVDYRGIPSSAPLPGSPGRQGSAYREILDTGGGKNQDFTQYEDLSFFLRDGQPLTGKTDRPDTSQGTFFFRFGPDTTNFYEFSTKMESRWEEWKEIRLTMNDLAELKLDPPETTRIVEGVPVPYRHRVVEGDTLGVYGAPSLTRVRRMTVGVRGDDALLPEGTVSGVIWFDEIRLRSVKKEPGFASRANANARFADFATLNGGIRKVDSEFRGIDGDRLGDDQLSLVARGDIQLHKFVDGRGLSLPFSMGYSDSRSIPRLSPNSDIELEAEADRIAAQSRSRARDITGRFSKVRPSAKPWVRYTIDNFSLSGSNVHERSISPYQRSTSERSTGLAQYNLNPGTGKTFRLLKRFDVSYFPTLKLAMNGNLSVTNQADILQDSTGVRTEVPRLPVRFRTLKATIGTVWDPIRSGSFDSQVTFNKTQDLDLDKTEALWESFKQGGREEVRDHTARFSWHPTRVRWLRPVFSYTTAYSEDQSQNAQDPNTPQRLRRIQNDSTREVSATLALRQLLPRKGDDEPRRAARRPTEGRTGPPQAGGDEEDPPVEGEPDLPPQEPPEGTAAPPDSAEAPRKGPPKLPSLGTIGSKFLGLAAAFGDVRFSYGDRRGSRYGRVAARPDLGYQLGFSSFDREDVVPGTQGVIEDRTDNSWITKIDTTFQPTSSLYLDGSYARTISRSEFNEARTKNDEVIFPDLSLSLDGLERRAFLKKLAKTSAVNSAYRQQTRYSGKLPPAGEPLPAGKRWYDTKFDRTEFAPLFSWTTSWNSGINTTVSYNRSTETNENFVVGESKRTRTDRGFRLNGRYSFAAPQGISVLGKRIRFRSDMTLNLDIDRGETREEQVVLTPGATQIVSVPSHSKQISIKPRATYNFSKKIQGSLDLGYARTNDLQRGRTDRTISIAVEALIKF